MFDLFIYKLIASFILLVYALIALIIAFYRSKPGDSLSHVLKSFCIILSTLMFSLILWLWKPRSKKAEVDYKE